MPDSQLQQACVCVWSWTLYWTSELGVHSYRWFWTFTACYLQCKAKEAKCDSKAQWPFSHRNSGGESRNPLKYCASWKFHFEPITLGELQIRCSQLSWMSWGGADLWKLSQKGFSRQHLSSDYNVFSGGWESFWMKRTKGWTCWWSIYLSHNMLLRK